MTDPQTIAAAMLAAEQDASPIAPFTRHNPFLGIDTAYRAQALTVEHRCQAGERVVGLKLGMTSKVKRGALGIHEPVFGTLTSAMMLPLGEPLSLDGLIRPRAEPELALLIGRRIPPAGSPVATVFDAVEAVIPAIELVDSRYSEWFRLADSFADSACAARWPYPMPRANRGARRAEGAGHRPG